MRIVVAILVVLALLLGAAVAFIKLTEDDKPSAPTIPAAVGQKTTTPVPVTPTSPTEVQQLGLTFTLTDDNRPYSVRVAQAEYADLSGAQQSTSVTISGTITDRVHNIKFWRAKNRFRLLAGAGNTLPGKITVRGSRTGMSYSAQFTGVPVQALRDRSVNFIIAVAPTRPQATPEPVFVGITPDRFRFVS